LSLQPISKWTTGWAMDLSSHFEAEYRWENRRVKSGSRFLAGMTERKARATTGANAGISPLRITKTRT
jgi:hypothetical protein